MSDGVSVDLGSTLPYVEEKLRSLIGYDQASVAFRALVDKHLSRAMRDAATVQIIGMDRPVSIFEIYQPISLTYPRSSESTTVHQLLARRQNAVIFGGPGRGKTILLHYVFASLANSQEYVPLLFTLRWPDATKELQLFVLNLITGKLPRKRKPLVLLVDGMDEISPEDRKAVAAALRDYSALDLGVFFLTCRSFYNVDDIKAHYVDLAPFSEDDSRGFIAAFAKAYGSVIAPDVLMAELKRHGFSDFATHPLMLAMICILKSSSMPELPQTPLRLIQRAIAVLTARWDDAKGVRRSTELPVDGEDRVRCMMHVAFVMRDSLDATVHVEDVVRKFLRLLHRPHLPAHSLLLEMAQWYGILVPITEAKWTFVHRTIHDYLAARFWVETGTFNPRNVRTWDSRAAYAACLLPNATDSIVAALHECNDLAPVIDCFYNGALYSEGRVAAALIEYFGRKPADFTLERQDSVCSVALATDFFEYVSDDLLYEFARRAAKERTPVRDVLFAYALAELRERGKMTLPSILLGVLKTSYNEECAFVVARRNDFVRVSLAEFAVE